MSRWMIIWMLLLCPLGCADDPTSNEGEGGDTQSADVLDDSLSEPDMGGCPEGCDDGNPCTFDECKSTYCWSTPLVGTPCDDGNACTAVDATVCQSDGSCGGSSLINCKDDSACTSDNCDPDIGCVFLPMNDGDGCNDGDACTASDVCLDGECVGVQIACEEPEACWVYAGCDPVSGECLVEKLPSGVSCDDDNLCTADDVCDDGLCLPGGMADCFDGNDCTDDGCTPKGGCVFSPNNQFCDDGDPCTSSDKCLGGQCKGDGLSCDDGNPCTSDSCDDSLECTHTPINQSCDDGNPCTVGDACQNGICVSGWTNSCDDSNPCTTDICSSVTGGCTHLDNSNPCDDGSVCTVSDACSGGLCQGLPASCNDGNPCTGTSCNPISGCLFETLEGPCDDKNGCTIADSCNEGNCEGYSICSDGNPCTFDECLPDGGCDYVILDGQSCSDGTECTQNDVCEGGLCSGIDVVCSDGDACTYDYCDNQSGCQNESIVDTLCNDGLECTLDGCANPGGCYHLAKEGPCGENLQGICVGDICCYPECAGKLCGSNGCGGTCGLCDPGSECVNGQCQTACVPSNECEPFECLDLDLNVCVNLMVHVPTSPFWMGCNQLVDNNCDLDEVPQHQVSLYAFDIDMTEVTNSAFAAFLNANNNVCGVVPCVDEAEVGLQVWKQAGVWKPEGSLGPYPAVHIPWATAEAYCLWVGKRLPTEAEWEKAARGGCDIYGEEQCKELEPVYPWGNQSPDCSVAVMNSPFVGCGTGTAYPVGSMPGGASPYGALDMAGNVWEWTSDWYAGDTFCNGPDATCYTSCSDCVGGFPYASPWIDPTGPPLGSHRVVKGGGYYSQGMFIRASARGGSEPQIDSIDVGFRCATSDF